MHLYKDGFDFKDSGYNFDLALFGDTQTEYVCQDLRQLRYDASCMIISNPIDLQYHHVEMY